ncbi:hypothetical protein [Candidatus Rhabdochlamydia porcellionis]|jgi:hypothetical protein|uniref:K1 capsule-specific polysaccharide lyase C-terminal domain-containing protein n=1 Tax=Candidatus Rhabdochlamydia porcellionis TaxID=225148 RepID=A0ABX8Z1Z6_9BACT|nr:hypothetical protein [Candidatus Rhabdochlamydia porcellionis]QZA59473.1 hypothetical protein RHAB15C_0001407 [Candidatus Rhabdochlamydia porcellionis]
MAKIANALNIPASSSTESLTLGNNNNFFGTNTLDCNGSAAFGSFAGIEATPNSLTVSDFLGVGTPTQALSNSTAEFVMSPTRLECDVYLTTYATSSSYRSALILRTAKGTAAAPTANLSGDPLGLISAGGYTGTTFTAISSAIYFSATEAWSTTANGTAINFLVTRNGTVAPLGLARMQSASASTSGLAIVYPGAGLMIKEGINCRMGRATLVAVLLSPSVVTVSNNTVTANTEIFLCSNVPSGGPGILSVTARVPGVSFTISSSAIGDTSIVAWLLIEPSP